MSSQHGEALEVTSAGSGDRGHGTEVAVEDVRSALIPTRQLRLAMDVLWGRLPPGIETDAVQKALWDIHEGICAAELKALREHGLNRQYTIIKPLNMMNLPDPETMQKIATAIQALADLGLILEPDDD